MMEWQKWVKYAAIAFAILLAVSIIGSIVAAVGFVVGITELDGVEDDLTVYEVSDSVTSLDLDIRAAAVEIKVGEKFSVESNLKHLEVKEKDGCLIIEETGSWGTVYHGATLILYLPAGTVFERADLSTGAGRFTVEELSAEKLSLELGAGEVVIRRLCAAKSCEIEGGAGAVTVKDGSLHDLSMEMGVGQLTMTAALTGVCDLEMGVGEADITLLGGKESYRVKINKGVGSAEVDGQSASDGETFGNGENLVTIDGGVGSIEVDFE